MPPFILFWYKVANYQGKKSTQTPHLCCCKTTKERNCSVQLVVINQIQHTQLLRTHIWRETTKDYKTGSLRIFSVYSDLHLLMIVPTRVLMNIIIIILLLLSLLLHYQKSFCKHFALIQAHLFQSSISLSGTILTKVLRHTVKFIRYIFAWDCCCCY